MEQGRHTNNNDNDDFCRSSIHSFRTLFRLRSSHTLYSCSCALSACQNGSFLRPNHPQCRSYQVSTTPAPRASSCLLSGRILIFSTNCVMADPRVSLRSISERRQASRRQHRSASMSGAVLSTHGTTSPQEPSGLA
jgi:hypothetical protein